jgi:hypothetical protein
MAIDTAAKRNSAIATRRLPWMRRFAPPTDGTIDQGDRQQVAFVYRGILSGLLDIVTGPFRYIAIGAHQPGAKAHGTHQPGAKEHGTHQPGGKVTGTL